MNFPKNAGLTDLIRPNGDQMLDYTKRYLPAGVLLGAGSAGLIHLMAKMRELKNEQQAQETNSDTLTVPVPIPAQKTAANPLSNISNAIGSAWKYLKAKPVIRLGGLAAAGTYAGAAALNAAKTPPSVGDNLFDAAAPIAIGGGSALLSYGIVDNMLKNRERKQLQARLDQAKDQYSTMLGQTLASANAAKSASLENADLFPTIHGICLGLVDAEFPDHEKQATSPLSLLGTAGLTGLPTLAAILAHKWMYNRQKEVDALHQSDKPKPPKQIRLVGIPQPAPVPITPEVEDQEQLMLPEPKMANELPELIGALAIGQAAKGEGERKEERPMRRPGLPPMPKLQEVGPGTAQITTSEGPVEIAAQDPATAQIMSHGGSKKLTQLLSIFQAQPEVSGVEQPGV